MSRGDAAATEAPGTGPPSPLWVATTLGPSSATRSRKGMPTSSSSRNQPPVGEAEVGGP